MFTLPSIFSESGHHHTLPRFGLSRHEEDAIRLMRYNFVPGSQFQPDLYQALAGAWRVKAGDGNVGYHVPDFSAAPYGRDAVFLCMTGEGDGVWPNLIHVRHVTDEWRIDAEIPAETLKGAKAGFLAVPQEVAVHVARYVTMRTLQQVRRYTEHIGTAKGSMMLTITITADQLDAVPRLWHRCAQYDAQPQED